MKKKWINKTVCALVALAMVFGLCFYAGEQVANAVIDAGSAAIATNPVNTSQMTVGTTLDLTGSYTATPPGTYTEAWSVKASNVGEVTFSTQTGPTTTITATKAGALTVQYTVTSTTDPTDTVTAELPLTVNPVPRTLVVPATASVNVGGTYTPQVAYSDGTTETNFTVSFPTNNFVSAVDAKTVRAINAGTVTLTVSAGGLTGTIDLTVLSLTPSFSLITPRGTTSSNAKPINVGESFTAEIATNHDGTITWETENANIVGIAKTSATTATVTGASVGGPVKLTVKATGSTRFADTSAEFYVYVGSPATITIGSDTAKIATVGGTATVTASVSGGGNLTAYSSDPSVAVVSVPTGTSGTLTITGMKAGSAAITVGGTATGTTKTIIVTVGNVKPVTTLSFNPNVSTLAKGESTVMTIHVDNPIVRSDGNAYAKVALANRRVVVSDYNYSKVNDREYWVRLDSSGNATVTIKPQYNGSAKVTVTADSATAVSKTFTVTGHPTLPQTGQDFTLIYVFGACCLAAVATWVVLYARKKKNSRAA